jgi:glycosyltransferase involved in cell wall biosynthesis
LKKKQSSVLYITYDGLLDPLGSSQILPYLDGIAAHPRSIHILSFEKPERMQAGVNTLKAKLKNKNIAWTPLTFTRNFGFSGKLYDLFRMYYVGFWVAITEKLKIVHARGHASAQVGLFLKRWLGLKLIFDFRGLWVDERVDKGGWNLNKPFHRWQYRYYKRVEHDLLQQADQIVVLTEAVIDEAIRLGTQSKSKITVIPCCADFDHFALTDQDERLAARTKLGIGKDTFVLGYLGSVGGMYMTDRFFRLVTFASMVIPDLHIFALTPDEERFKSEMQTYLPARQHRFVHVQSATRNEVAKLLPSIDLLVSFIKPSYARMSTSPTKLAESFAAGIPVICNYGVGDVTVLVSELDAGVVIDADSDDALFEVANTLPSLALKGGYRLRNLARKKLGLEVAAFHYNNVYRKLDAVC